MQKEILRPELLLFLPCRKLVKNFGAVSGRAYAGPDLCDFALRIIIRLLLGLAKAVFTDVIVALKASPIVDIFFEGVFSTSYTV